MTILDDDIRQQVIDALDMIGADNKILFKVNGVGDTLEISAFPAIVSKGGVNDQSPIEMEKLKQGLRLHGLPEELAGKTIHCNGTPFVVIGFKDNAKFYCFVLRNERGRKVAVTPEFIKQSTMVP